MSLREHRRKHEARRGPIVPAIRRERSSLHQLACREILYLFVELMYGHWKTAATLGFSENHDRVLREAIDRLIDAYLAR